MYMSTEFLTRIFPIAFSLMVLSLIVVSCNAESQGEDEGSRQTGEDNVEKADDNAVEQEDGVDKKNSTSNNVELPDAINVPSQDIEFSELSLACQKTENGKKGTLQCFARSLDGEEYGIDLSKITSVKFDADGSSLGNCHAFFVNHQRARIQELKCDVEVYASTKLESIVFSLHAETEKISISWPEIPE